MNGGGTSQWRDARWRAQGDERLVADGNTNRRPLLLDVFFVRVYDSLRHASQCGSEGGLLKRLEASGGAGRVAGHASIPSRLKSTRLALSPSRQVLILTQYTHPRLLYIDAFETR